MRRGQQNLRSSRVSVRRARAKLHAGCGAARRIAVGGESHRSCSRGTAGHAPSDAHDTQLDAHGGRETPRGQLESAHCRHRSRARIRRRAPRQTIARRERPISSGTLASVCRPTAPPSPGSSANCGIVGECTAAHGRDHTTRFPSILTARRRRRLLSTRRSYAHDLFVLESRRSRMPSSLGAAALPVRIRHASDAHRARRCNDRRPRALHGRESPRDALTSARSMHRGGNLEE